ncbi:MAG: Fis family transcriptional regulator, partial [Pseudomonadota bacterium]|nr:Fis family transcriptional regulator [Pseudomonadota bacterium]
MFEQNVTSPFITNPHVQSHEKPQPLRDAVKKAVHHYLKQLNGQDVQDVY